MASVVNRIIKNTGWLYAKMGITLFLSLLTTRLVLSALGTTDFGIYNVVGGAIGMLGFLSSAMSSTTQRFMSYAEGENNQASKIVIFNISLVIHFCVALLSVVILIGAGFYLLNGVLNIPEERLPAVYVVYGSLVCSTFFTITTVPYEAVLNSHENMKYYSLVSILDAILKLIVAYYCTKTTYDSLIIYGILMSVVPILILTIMRIYCHAKYTECKISVIKYYDKNKAKDIVKFASWSLLGQIGGIVGNYGQNIISNIFFGVIINAAEGVCAQVHSMLLVFSNNMLKSLNPVIVKSEGEHNREKMISWSLRGCKYAFIMFIWLTVPFAFEANYILQLWLGEVPEWTVFFIQMVFLRTQIELMFGSLVISLGAIGEIQSYNKIYSGLFITALGIVYVANSLGSGPEFRYWLLLFFIIVQGVATIFLSNRYFGLQYFRYFESVLKPVLILTISVISPAYLICQLLAEGPCRLIITTITTWVVLVISLFTFFTDRSEKNYIKNILKKVFLSLNIRIKI